MPAPNPKVHVSPPLDEPAEAAPAAAPATQVPVEQTSLAARVRDPDEVTLRFNRWHAHASTAYQRGEFAGFRRQVAQRLVASGVASLAEGAPVHADASDRFMVTK